MSEWTLGEQQALRRTVDARHQHNVADNAERPMACENRRLTDLVLFS